MGNVLDDGIAHARPVSRQRRIVHTPPSLLIPGDELLLNQMFFGLLSNGAKAAQQGDGQLFIRLR